MIPAGTLDERVTFQRVTVTRDETGEPDEDWNDLTTRWARVEPLTGRETDGPLQTRAEVDYRVTVRRDATTRTLTPRDRAVRNGRTLGIVHVLDHGPRGAGVELLVTETP